MPLGERMRQLRNEHNWSQGDLATKIGGDAGQISRYETNKMTPTADIIVRIAEALDTSCDYLLVDRAPRRPFDTPNHPLGDRLNEIDELTNDDQTAILHIIDALVANKRVTAALTETS